MPKLSDSQIQQKLQEGRNYKRLYGELKVRFDELAAEHRQCSQLLADQQAVIETLKIQIAELQTMVFGKKKRPPMGGTPIGADQVALGTPKQPRTKDSYRRPVPPATAITTEVAVPLPGVCVCGGNFDPSSVTTHERYEEDIPLPELTPGYNAKLVTKYVITKGICNRCGKATVGNNTDLGGAQVSLGPNIRLLVVHLVSVGGMSYAQVVNLCLSLYGLHITDGEISNILSKQHQKWLPAYDQLKTDIRAAPVVHGDETPWPIQDLQGAGYAWNMCDANSPRVCFALEQSRGAIYAQTLFGQDTDKPFTGIRITDDYSPYRNPELPGKQQLCWAHPYRTIRDLTYNANLPEIQVAYATCWYECFAAIYQDLRQYLDEPYDLVVRETQATELWQRVQQLAQQPAPRTGEPQKLTRLKAQLLRVGKDRLFICLPENTPCDNNRAERDLRQLVLKRKRSFGSKTERGAQALATVLSLCTTTWRMYPNGYFTQLALLGGV
jgi:transposase